jgi:hypothetical protein
LDDDLEADAIKRTVLFLEAPRASEGVTRALAGENHEGLPLHRRGS